MDERQSFFKRRIMTLCSLSTVKLFFESTSIRGFSRIVKTNSSFLRVLWTVFVVSTTVFLAVSVFKIVADYREYSVNIQTYIVIEGESPFPAVTFCNNQPFSKRAYKVWEKGEVKSPTDFNRKMRQFGNFKLQELHDNPNTSISQTAFEMATGFDRLSTYYQQLRPSQSIELGHDKSSIHLCVFRYLKSMAFAPECEDTMITVRNFSHPSFFNCFTIEAIPEVTHQIKHLGLVVWLGPTEDYDIKYREGFLFDIFEQAYGLRVVVHEPGSFPNVERNGIQIEPGKMNDINYQAVKYQKKNTIRKPCFEKTDQTFTDLYNNYTYEIELCLNAEIQRRILKNCHCIYGDLPRLVIPSVEVPYCAKLDLEKLGKRVLCVKSIIENSIEIKKQLELTKCLPRCVNWKYKNTISVTKWRVAKWQLYWMRQAHSRFNNLDKKIQQKKNFSIEFNRVSEFLTKENLTKLDEEGKEGITFDDRYSFVLIKRKSNNTFVEEEKLVLTLNALFSRIGGLCSLYIGMTLAVVIEIIEFFFIIIFGSKSSSNKSAAQPRQTMVPDLTNDDFTEDQMRNIPLRSFEEDLQEESYNKLRFNGTETHNSSEDQVWVPNRHSKSMVQTFYVQ